MIRLDYYMHLILQGFFLLQILKDSHPNCNIANKKPRSAQVACNGIGSTLKWLTPQVKQINGRQCSIFMHKMIPKLVF